MQKHNGEGDIRILCKHHSRADARNSYEAGSRLEMGISACLVEPKSHYYQVNMRMNIATCFNKILLEIERKLKGIYDQKGNC